MILTHCQNLPDLLMQIKMDVCICCGSCYDCCATTVTHLRYLATNPGTYPQLVKLIDNDDSQMHTYHKVPKMPSGALVTSITIQPQRIDVHINLQTILLSTIYKYHLILPMEEQMKKRGLG